MKIALLSFGDINNYGDTFFPYLAYNEIKKRISFAKIDLVTNVESDINGIKTKIFSLEMIRKYDAVIVVGGETIHDMDNEVWNPVYRSLGKENTNKTPSDIIFAWRNEKIPFKAWFSVGVPPLKDSTWPKMIDVLNQFDYISVRGVLSKKIVENDYIANNPNINITPDLGWLFPKYIKNDLETKKRICKRYNLQKFYKEPYIVVQFHDSTNPNIDEISRSLSKFKKDTGINIILLPFIKPWDDYKAMEPISIICGDDVILLPPDISFLDIGTILVNAKFFVGSSLHGAVTLLAQGKPAGIVHTWPGTKYQDMLGMQFRNKYFTNDWLNFEKMLYDLLAESKKKHDDLEYYSRFMEIKLCDSFDELCDKIKEKCV